MRLDNERLAVILGALRHLQSDLDKFGERGVLARISEIITDFGKFEMPDAEWIDRLCEDLNTGAFDGAPSAAGLRMAIEDHLEWMTNGGVVNGVHYDTASAREALEMALNTAAGRTAKMAAKHAAELIWKTYERRIGQDPVPSDGVNPGTAGGLDKGAVIVTMSGIIERVIGSVAAVTRQDLIGLLSEAESFMSGFEDDDTQEEPIDDLLERMRTAIGDEDRPAAKLVIMVDGGLVQGVISDRPADFEGVKIISIDYDVQDGMFYVPNEHGQDVVAHVANWDVELCTIDLDGIRMVEEDRPDDDRPETDDGGEDLPGLPLA